MAHVTLLREDGSGKPYRRPTKGGRRDTYTTVPHEFWLEGPEAGERWHEVLRLPELAFLTIALAHGDGFPLPYERMPERYGFSADTALRGATGLAEWGLLDVERTPKKAPLAAEGYTIENRYTLLPPFGPRGFESSSSGSRTRGRRRG